MVMYKMIAFKLLMSTLTTLLTSCSSTGQVISSGSGSAQLPMSIHQRADVSEFNNIYPSTFLGKGPHSKYDQVDYLLESERAFKSYTVVSRGNMDFDRVLGYDYRNFMVKPDIKTLKFSKIPSVTWLGHASFLLKLSDGTSLLTDPVFGDFDGIIGSLSHFLFDEFERIAPSVVSASELDFVDAVLVSHNHYDHFNMETIGQLGPNINYYVPLNFENYFTDNFSHVYAMDWYTGRQLNQNKVHFVPAHHYSGRSFFDENETLWGGWVVESNNLKIYFSGDTGYTPIFKDIVAKYGEMDVCLMAIVAYAFDGRDIHMAPEDALKSADELGCKTFIPWGYGTWATGYEHVLEPLRRLRHAMIDNHYQFEIVELKMGETLTFKR